MERVLRFLILITLILILIGITLGFSLFTHQTVEFWEVKKIDIYNESLLICQKQKERCDVIPAPSLEKKRMHKMIVVKKKNKFYFFAE